MILSRKFQADLLRDKIATTLPGDSWIYVVASGDKLDSIIQQKVLGNKSTPGQVGFYVDRVVADVRNHLNTSSQVLVPGQIIYIPKRVA